MGTWRVALSPEAESDLEQLTGFLARKSPSAAERVGLELVGMISSLDSLPARGAPMRDRPACARWCTGTIL